jgi:hypothetical protein
MVSQWLLNLIYNLNLLRALLKVGKKHVALSLPGALWNCNLVAWNGDPNNIWWAFPSASNLVSTLHPRLFLHLTFYSDMFLFSWWNVNRGTLYLVWNSPVSQYKQILRSKVLPCEFIQSFHPFVLEKKLYFDTTASTMLVKFYSIYNFFITED